MLPLINTLHIYCRDSCPCDRATVNTVQTSMTPLASSCQRLNTGYLSNKNRSTAQVSVDPCRSCVLIKNHKLETRDESLFPHFPSPVVYFNTSGRTSGLNLPLCFTTRLDADTGTQMQFRYVWQRLQQTSRSADSFVFIAFHPELLP